MLEEKRNQLNQGIDFTDSYLDTGPDGHFFFRFFLDCNIYIPIDFKSKKQESKIFR